MEMNLRMQRLFEEVRRENKDHPVQLNQALCQLTDLGFTRVGDCVLFTSQITLTRSVSPDDFPDLTGYECFVNHIHIEDYFSEPVSHIELTKQGKAFARRLEEQLSLFSSDEQFKIIVSVSDAECNVRFHKIRLDENWLASDLDKYQEAILVLDTIPEQL